ncbi:hypothetical protein ACE1OC_00390 [Streptomyces sp. DSM 116496]
MKKLAAICSIALAIAIGGAGMAQADESASAAVPEVGTYSLYW